MNRRTFLGMAMPIPTIDVEMLEINERIVLDSHQTGLEWYDFPEHDDYDVLTYNCGTVYDNNVADYRADIAGDISHSTWKHWLS